MQQFLSTGQIALQLGIPQWRVHYLLTSRGIKECQRVGNCRLFLPEIVETLREELADINKKKRNINSAVGVA